MGQVLVMEPGQCYRLVETADNLTYPMLQKIIGGWVGVALRVPAEQIHKVLPNTKSKSNMIIFCDDEGYLKELPPTCGRASDGHMLVGPVVYARYTEYWDEDGRDERYHPLDKIQLADFVKMLKNMNWNELMLDEIDYSNGIIMSGGEVGEA